MRKTFVQGGSVKVFVIVGIILSIVALTVLYFAGRQATSGQVPPMFVPESSQSDPKDEANDSVDSDSDKPSHNTTKEEDKSAADNQGSDAGKTDEKGGTQGANDSASSQDSGSSSTETKGESATALPKSGPSDSLLQAFAALVLTFSLVAYLRSLRIN